jgi:hypothetical protein
MPAISAEAAGDVATTSMARPRVAAVVVTNLHMVTSDFKFAIVS